MATSNSSRNSRKTKAVVAPLASVATVFHNLALCKPSGESVGGDWESLPHVVNLVSAFLNDAIPKRWSIERAVGRGFGLRMLK